MENTYKENLLIAQNLIQDLLKNDTFDWTHKYGDIYINVAIEYLENAKNILNKKEA